MLPMCNRVGFYVNIFRKRTVPGILNSIKNVNSGERNCIRIIRWMSVYLGLIPDLHREG